MTESLVLKQIIAGQGEWYRLYTVLKHVVFGINCVLCTHTPNLICTMSVLSIRANQGQNTELINYSHDYS